MCVDCVTREVTAYRYYTAMQSLMWKCCRNLAVSCNFAAGNKTKTNISPEKKVNADGRLFQPRWEGKYMFVLQGEKL